MRAFWVFWCGVVIAICGSLSALSAAEAASQIGSLVMKVDVQPALKVANDRFFETALDVSLINQSPGSIRLDKTPLRVNVLFSSPGPSVPDQFGPPMSYAMNPSADPKDNVVFLQSGELIGKRFPIMLAANATAHITVLFDIHTSFSSPAALALRILLLSMISEQAPHPTQSAARPLYH